MGLKITSEKENVPIYEAITSDLAEVKIVEVDLQGESVKKRVPSHWHRSIEIVVPIINGAYMIDENEEYHIHPGHYYVVNSRSIHSFYNKGDIDRYYGFAIQVNYNFLKKICPDFDNIEFKRENNIPEVYNIIIELVEMYKSQDEFKTLKIQGLVYILMYNLLKHSATIRQEDTKNQKHKELMIQITKFIDENYAQDITVDTIADQFNLSYGYLSTIFKQYMGYGVKEYINYIRIKKSEADLKNKHLSITEVYLRNGFTNSKSYYREFRKYHSVSPKEYREREQN